MPSEPSNGQPQALQPHEAHGFNVEPDGAACDGRRAVTDPESFSVGFEPGVRILGVHGRELAEEKSAEVAEPGIAGAELLVEDCPEHEFLSAASHAVEALCEPRVDVQAHRRVGECGDETLREGLVRLGAVQEREGLPTTSPRPRYALTADFAALFHLNLLDEPLQAQIARWQEANLSPGALARIGLPARTRRSAFTSRSAAITNR